ncbi:MAG TPA: universal stress protein [Solirubrobacteraceae bacterium]|nr:universal stress protein [Solirubrobacteraceae bacterium]HME04139.1 universal stress protein [Solirubrobacteraceae bacterium]
MRLDDTLSRDVIHGSDESRVEGPPRRVLVLFEPCRSGRAALREAAEVANAGSELTVATLAPQARVRRCCRAGGDGLYNIAVRQQAEAELDDARRSLGAVAGKATFTVLAGCPQPRLLPWVREHAFDLVLVPFHRLTLGGSPVARRLRRATTAEVRLVR